MKNQKKLIGFLMISLTVIIVILVGCDRDKDPINTIEEESAWGKIANKGIEGQKIATTLYFPGTPRDVSLYTAHPLPDETGFSDKDISLQLKRMKSIGINSVQISFFGRNYAEGSGYLPMYASSGNVVGDVLNTYNSLIRKIEQENMFFFPLIEVSDKFLFAFEFPDNLDNMINRISWWMENFGNSPNWLEVYDKNGQPRKVVSLIETIKLAPYNSLAFSNGFKNVAERIYDKYKINIGFAIDPTRLPPEGGVNYGPQPSELKNNDYILIILPWDITADGGNESEKIDWAKNFLKKWRDNNYPVVSFVIPGYDGHIVFPNNQIYGKTDAWRESQKELADPEFGSAGVSVGPWNGWTEYFHITCSQEEADKNLKWAKEIIDINNFRYPDSSGISCSH